jgi:integrase
MEAKKLDTHTETKTVCAGENTADLKGTLVQFAFYCKKEGMRESTIKTFNRTLARLAKVANINDTENIKEAIAASDVVENTKVAYCVAYMAYLKFTGKTWKTPKYTYQQKLPEFLPTEEEIDQLIAGSGRKLASILQSIKETGMRIGECLSLKWTCIDFERRIVTLNTPEKNSLPRVFNVSNILIGMLGKLPKHNDKVFGGLTTSGASSSLKHSRRRLSNKLSNPRLAKIYFHLIRHWFGTTEYHKKPDMDYVRRLLGHKSILNTQIYVNLEKVYFNDVKDDYIVKVASTVEEATQLMEVGFDYVTEMNGKKLFRKRK